MVGAFWYFVYRVDMYVFTGQIGLYKERVFYKRRGFGICPVFEKIGGRIRICLLNTFRRVPYQCLYGPVGCIFRFYIGRVVKRLTQDQ